MRAGRCKTKGTRALLIGHLDTVLQGEAFRRDGRRGYGSGSSDMTALTRRAALLLDRILWTARPGAR